jgi:hypothetical protein
VFLPMFLYANDDMLRCNMLSFEEVESTPF